MKKKLITRICVCAILAALYFVLDLISIKAGPFKLSVSGLPIIIVALFYGPIDAMIVGFTGAFLGQLLSYGFTPTTLLWCLPAVARGLFVGLLTRKLSVKDEPIKLVLIIIVSSLLVTTINTVVMYIDSVIYDYYSHAYIFGALLYRYIAGILTAIIYSAVTPIIYEPVSKVLNVKKESKNINSNEKLIKVFNYLAIIFGIASIVTCIFFYVSIISACLGIICVFITRQIKNNKGLKYLIYGIIIAFSALILKLIIEAIADVIIQIILEVLSNLF